MPVVMPLKPPTKQTLSLADIWPAARARRWAQLSGIQDVRYTISGRAAIYQYLAALKVHLGPNSPRKTVLVPAFHCPTVVDPVLHAGFDIRYYAITEHLTIDRGDFANKLDNRVAAVLFIRYFGVGTLQADLLAQVRQSGAKAIDDCSHSFLVNEPLGLAGTTADAAIYSFWKLLPSGVTGGGLWCRDSQVLRHLPTLDSPSLRKSAALLKELLVELKDNILSPAQSQIGVGDYRVQIAAALPAIRKEYKNAYPYDELASREALTSAARWILQAADLPSTIERRRSNYQVFCNALHSNSELTPVVPKLLPQDVPWGVPVLINRRYERDYLIRARGVPLFSFGEVLHPQLLGLRSAERKMVDVACSLSENLVGFSIHQQLSSEAVKAYAGIVNDFMAALKA